VEKRTSRSKIKICFDIGSTVNRTISGMIVKDSTIGTTPNDDHDEGAKSNVVCTMTAAGGGRATMTERASEDAGVLAPAAADGKQADEQQHATRSILARL